MELSSDHPHSAVRVRRLSVRVLVTRGLFYVPLALFIAVTFAPIYWIILSAFTPISELFTSPLRYFPRHPSLVNFQTAAQIVSIGQQLANSTILSVSSSALTVAVCLLASYAFARIRFPGSSFFFLALLLSSFLPSIATIIPLFQLFQNLSLVDTLQGLIILYVSFLLPFSIWIMTSFIRQVPVELEEAAQVDGANFPTILWQIVIPVLRPALATIFLLNLVASWDEFFLPLIFSRTDATAPLTLGITQAAIDPRFQSVAWGNEAAMGLIVIVPVFVVAMVFQKQIVEGLMAGALKG